MKKFYTRKEELWNAWSHAGGIVMGVIFGIIFLVWCIQSHSNWATVGVSLWNADVVYCLYVVSCIV